MGGMLFAEAKFYSCFFTFNVHRKYSRFKNVLKLENQKTKKTQDSADHFPRLHFTKYVNLNGHENVLTTFCLDKQVIKVALVGFTTLDTFIIAE